MLKKQAYFLVMLVLFIVGTPAKAQVTIGEDTPPMVVSVLELVTNAGSNGEYGGLRLPQLSGVNISILKQSITSGNLTERAKGLTIFNTTTNCIEVWNGKEFKSLCGDIGQAVLEFDCSRLKVYPHNGTEPMDYKQNRPVDGSTHYITIPVVATKAGTYSVSVTTGNGYSFVANGMYSDPGDYLLRLEGQGTPITGGAGYYDNLSIRFNNDPITSCTPTERIPVEPATDFATFTFNCMQTTLGATPIINKPLDNTNKITIQVDVTALGDFAFTASVNGMKFSRNGTFTVTGVQTVDLLASGMPIQVGTFPLVIEGQLPGGATETCTTNISVAYRSVKVLGIGGSNYSPTAGNDRTTTAVLQSPYNFGPTSNAKVKVENISISTLSASATNAQIQSAIDNGTDIIVIGYAFYPDAAQINTLVDFVKNKNGVVIAAIGESSSSARYLLAGMCGGSPSTTSTNLSGESVNNIQDPTLNGPFGDIRGSSDIIAPDGTDGVRFANLPSDAIALAGSNSAALLVRHKTYPFFIIGDGGALTGHPTTYDTSDTYYPAFIDSSGRPLKKSWSGRQACNSLFYANAIAYGIQYVQANK